MKVIRLDNNRQIKYFSTMAKASAWLNRHLASVKYAIENNKMINDFKISWTDDKSISIAMVDVD